ncbi:hypothetical protein P280DRAFT_469226 [Massarina eburnea CBS 473.64]|uniref:Mso1 N-terminal domain-containing protein n=1 Tax=Massarina eburnea CBS 473.64 TaxID=1395130 RepID=A0A6A6RYK3_9PLEO|nr:hypothetical protein P280DRAFT_469226 [Massarina eburnea CBS 473.64]
MSSYLNNLLTTTTSRYNSIRRQLLSDEADGDTEDDTHISRVLRAYYTEKGRPFPQWLPPDPKAPPQAAPVQMASSAGRYGNMGPPQQVGRGGGAISDLWDAPAQPPPQQEPMSLRRAQGRGGGRPGMALSPEPQSQGRPLPSQRAGSYQSGNFRAAEPSPPPSAGSGVSAQDRLKARLWGSGRSNSAQSVPSSTNSSPATTPVESRMRSPFGGDRGARPPYPEERGGSYSGGGGGKPQGDQGYKASANSPWAGNDDPYGPSYNSGPPQERRRMGLPSGPRMR